MTKSAFLILAIAAGALSQGPAFAQSQSGARGSSGASQSMTQGAQTLPQRIQQKLQSQGFTDIRVVPEGYVVSAKDKDGDPVTMIIGPHSIAMFTVSQSNQTGSSEQGHYGSSAPLNDDTGGGAGGSGAGSRGMGSGTGTSGSGSR